MSFLKKHKTKIFVLIFICFAFYSVSSVVTIEDEKEMVSNETVTKKEETKKTTEKIKEEKVIVDVKGEVTTPGVYELLSTNTVMDAINMAGGLTKQSDTSNINLSKKLSDEMVIIVYSSSKIKEMKEAEEVICPPCNNACITEEDKTAELKDEEIETESTQTTGKININTATTEELQALSGIGETKAQAIVDYRTQNGKFETIEDLKNVSGIGDSTFEKIKENITV